MTGNLTGETLKIKNMTKVENIPTKWDEVSKKSHMKKLVAKVGKFNLLS
jgi:hypothetical protein